MGLHGRRMVRAPRRAPHLRGREEHLGRIQQYLHEVASTGQARAVVLGGPPQSGKTQLILDAIEIAESRGFAALRGSLEELDRPAGLVADAAEPGWQPSSPVILQRVTRVVLHAASPLTQRPSGTPTVIAIDDLDWSDRNGMYAVRALLRSLRAAPVLSLLAFRQMDDEPDVSALGSEGIVVGVLPRLGPLVGDELTALVADLVGARPSPRLRALVEGAGDPATVAELVRGLVSEQVVRVEGGVAKLVARAEPPDVRADRGVPGVPVRFRNRVAARLDALPDRVRQLLQVAAVVGPDFAPDDVAELLGLTPAGILPLVQEAIRHNLLEARDDRLAFRSGAVWTSVLAMVPDPVRLMLHRHAARIMLGRHRDRAAAAAHLAWGARAGDFGAIALLTEVSAELLTAEPARAAELAVRGLRLCPDGGPERDRLAITAANALIWKGALGSAVRVCDENAAPGAGPGLDLCRATALLLKGEPRQAGGIARRLLADPACDRDSHDRAEVVALGVDALTDVTAAVTRAERLLADPGTATRAPEVRVAARVVMSGELWRTGRVTEAVERLDDAGAGYWFQNPEWYRATWLVKLSRFAEADEAISRAETASGASGLLGAVTATLRSTLLLARGELAAAATTAEAGLQGGVRSEMPLFTPPALAVLAMVALHRGDLLVAGEYADRIDELLPRERARPWWALGLLVGARVAGAVHGPQSALDLLAEVGHNAGARREVVLECPAAAAWIVRTALKAGRRWVADAVVETTQSLWRDNPALPALRCAAGHARALFERDPEQLAAVAHHYEDVMAMVNATEDLAALLSDVDRPAAIERFDDALTAYRRMDATWHAARVKRRLRSLGVRRRDWRHAKRADTGWESLTETETRVAKLVAEGLTNREAAAQLFVSSHTVGFHLRQVYRKLDVRSRTELARLARLSPYVPRPTPAGRRKSGRAPGDHSCKQGVERAQ
jgi:DNA-binding CsgD family transcriptional regulator